MKNSYLFELDSQDTEILIRLSSRCSSNCYNCSLPYLKNNKFYNTINLDKLLLFIGDNFICKNKIIIGLLGSNLLDNIDYYKNTFLNYNHFIFSLQLSIDEMLLGVSKIKKIKSNNIIYSSQIISRSLDTLKKIIKLIQLYRDLDINARVNLIIDFGKFKKFIEYLLKTYNFDYISNNIISINAGSLYLELENDLYYDKIEKFSYNSCLGYENFYIGNKTIVIKNDIEFTLSGDIKFHLNNFCNKGIKKIANVNDPKEVIINKFRKLSLILSNYNNFKDKCERCNKFPIYL